MKKIWDYLFLPAVLLASGAVLFLGLRCYYRGAYPLGYQEEVEAWSAENGLDPALSMPSSAPKAALTRRPSPRWGPGG